MLEWRSHTAVVTGSGSANSTSTRCQQPAAAVLQNFIDVEVELADVDHVTSRSFANHSSHFMTADDLIIAAQSK